MRRPLVCNLLWGLDGLSWLHGDDGLLLALALSQLLLPSWLFNVNTLPTPHSTSNHRPRSEILKANWCTKIHILRVLVFMHYWGLKNIHDHSMICMYTHLGHTMASQGLNMDISVTEYLMSIDLGGRLAQSYLPLLPAIVTCSRRWSSPSASSIRYHWRTHEHIQQRSTCPGWPTASLLTIFAIIWAKLLVTPLGHCQPLTLGISVMPWWILA